MQDYVGYRTKKRQAKKKKSGRLWKWMVALGVIVLIFVILGAVIKVYPFDTAWDKTADGFVWLGRKVKNVWPWKASEELAATDFLPEGKKTANYLFVVTKEQGDITSVSTVVLASYDSTDDSGSLIYFPNDLIVDVPGIGRDQLYNLVEIDEGRVTLTLVTVENILGVAVDRYVMGTDRDLRIILNQVSDNYPVDVPEKLEYRDESLQVDVDLEPGEQNLSGNVLASYLTFSETGQKMELIERQKGFVPVFLEKSKAVSSGIEELAGKNANLFDTDASNREIAGIWQAYALMLPNKLKQQAIPVKEFRFENTVVHRVDTEKLPSFVEEYVKGSTGDGVSAQDRYRVELLNGCGVPGIGETVAAELSLDDYEIVSGGNADSFDHPETVIIVYEDTDAAKKAAEEIRNVLEVGRVEVQPRGQDLTDITVVIGKDYSSK